MLSAVCCSDISEDLEPANQKYIVQGPPWNLRCGNPTLSTSNLGLKARGLAIKDVSAYLVNTLL